jgi:hypothetical protein
MHYARTIHRQCLGGCPSYDRFAKSVTAIVTPAKMSVPTLLPGVEQSHAASRLGILPCDVRTLRIVAHRARVAQVVQCSLTTHRPRNNVVDFERFGTQLLLQLAVFAAERRSLGNELAKMSRDVCRWGHRHNARYQCSAPQRSQVTDVLSKGYEDFPERVSSQAMSRVLHSNWSTKASSSRLSSAVSVLLLPLARSADIRFRWRAGMRNVPRTRCAAARASSVVGRRWMSSNNFRRCGSGNWIMASRNCSRVSSTVAIESPYGKEFARDTTHTKVAKIRAKWTRMNKRNTFWPCIIPQKGEPKPCYTQSSTRRNSFSAVQTARYRGRDTR